MKLDLLEKLLLALIRIKPAVVVGLYTALGGSNPCLEFHVNSVLPFCLISISFDWNLCRNVLQIRVGEQLLVKAFMGSLALPDVGKETG